MDKYRVWIWETSDKEDTYKEWFSWDNKFGAPTIEDVAREVEVEVDMICQFSKISKAEAAGLD